MNFAFLVHSRDYTDVQRKFWFAKFLPKAWVEFWCKHWPPIIISKIDGPKHAMSGEKIKGWLIGIPMTARQMIENKELAKKRILQAALRAEKLGAKIVGLGALTSSMTFGGQDIKRDLKIFLTPGHAFTVFTVTKYALEAIKLFSLPKDKITIAIVGAAGSIGSGSAYFLKDAGINNFILIDLERKAERVKNLLENMAKHNPKLNIKISHKISDIKPADIIIAATNAPEALIGPDVLKPGAIVIDDAQPTDISPEVQKQREDVLVVDGGVASTPDVNMHFNIGLARKTDIPSCLGEVISLASHSSFMDYKPGELLNPRHVKEIGQFGKSLGFEIKDFQRLGKIYPQEKIEYIKKIISQNF